MYTGKRLITVVLLVIVWVDDILSFSILDAESGLFNSELSYQPHSISVLIWTMMKLRGIIR